MARLSEIGKKFERIKENEGECTIMGKKEMDQAKERQAMLYKENKLQEETIKKKNSKILELSGSLEALQAELTKSTKDLVSRSTEIDKLLVKLKESDSDKLKYQNQITEQHTEIKSLKSKIEKIQEDSKRKVREVEEKNKRTEGLGSEIQSLKDQLDQKIKMMNSVATKNQNLGDSEARLKDEIRKSESLMRINQEINGKLSQSEISIAGIREELRLKEIELDMLKRNSTEKSSISELQLSQMKEELASLRKEVMVIQEERDRLKESEKLASISMMEYASKLKGALMRLEEAEKTLAKYDVPKLEKSLQEMREKGDALGKAAERIKTAMNTLKIAVICRKCDSFPKEGKTLFPCGHCFCAACESPSASSCSDCKKAVETRVANPLINEVKMSYSYMNDLIGFMIETSQLFSKPAAS